MPKTLSLEILLNCSRLMIYQKRLRRWPRIRWRLTSEKSLNELIKAMFTPSTRIQSAGTNGFKCHETFFRDDRWNARLSTRKYTRLAQHFRSQEKPLCCGTSSKYSSPSPVESHHSRGDFVKRSRQFSWKCFDWYSYTHDTGRGNPGQPIFVHAVVLPMLHRREPAWYIRCYFRWTKPRVS
jgi:hypothetical protein